MQYIGYILCCMCAYDLLHSIYYNGIYTVHRTVYSVRCKRYSYIYIYIYVYGIRYMLYIIPFKCIHYATHHIYISNHWRNLTFTLNCLSYYILASYYPLNFSLSSPAADELLVAIKPTTATC